MNDRERWLAETFVDIADTLVSDYDIIDYLARVAEHCAAFLDKADVGIMLGDRPEKLDLMVSSSDRMRTVELFELQSVEGPCLDCAEAGEPLVNVVLGDVPDDRWPRFRRKAMDAGYGVVHALPLRLRADVIGVMNVFVAAGRQLGASDAAVLQALADAATIGILQERAVARAEGMADQLQRALISRISIEQAKGILAERMGVSVEEAFEILRRHTRFTNQRLADTAGRVVRGEIAVEDLHLTGADGGPPTA